MTIRQSVSDRVDKRPRFDDADDFLTRAPTDMAMPTAIDCAPKTTAARRLREAEPTLEQLRRQGARPAVETRSHRLTLRDRGKSQKLNET
jgi:hypothetical protein